MAIIRKYADSDQMRDKDVTSAMAAIENYHFQFTQLTKTGSTGGTRGRYNRFALQLAAASTTSEIQEAISDLQLKLRNSLPERSKSILGFQELIYAPGLKLTQAQKSRGSKELITYTLLTMVKYNKNILSSQGRKTWSIEHIRPQAEAQDTPDDPCFSIGNLTLLTAGANNSLSDLQFDAKRPGLKKHCLYIDDTLQQWLAGTESTLTCKMIQDRTEALACEAIDKVWAL